MSDQFDPNAPTFVKGPYSKAKAVRVTAGTTGGITGFTIAANYIAPMIMVYADRWHIPVPPELTVGVMAGVLAGALAFVYDIARYRGWLDWAKRGDGQ